MNYHNLSMLELVTYLSDELDPDRFIEASKVFVQNFVDGNYVPREIHDEALEAAKESSFSEGFNIGHQEGYDEAQTEEMG